jgi:hypothetical protein
VLKSSQSNTAAICVKISIPAIALLLLHFDIFSSSLKGHLFRVLEKSPAETTTSVWGSMNFRMAPDTCSGVSERT